MKQGDALASTFRLFCINDLIKVIDVLNSGIRGRDLMRFLFYGDDIILLSGFCVRNVDMVINKKQTEINNFRNLPRYNLKLTDACRMI